MANSSWTAEHVRQLFLSWAPPERVYPPCDTADLAALPLERKLKRLYIVSLAQVPPLSMECRTKLHPSACGRFMPLLPMSCTCTRSSKGSWQPLDVHCNPCHVLELAFECMVIGGSIGDSRLQLHASVSGVLW
jgi:hypothetical protein